MLKEVVFLLLPVFFGAVIAVPIGQFITRSIDHNKKRRENELNTINEFYSVYGEFFAIWKLLNFSIESGSFDQNQHNIFDRASRLEARFEAIALKLCCERVLSSDEVCNLGLLRQYFQIPRERIRDARKIDFGRSGHPGYLSFKKSSSLLGNTISRVSATQPSRALAVQQFHRITSNCFEAICRETSKSGYPSWDSLRDSDKLIWD